MAAITPRTVVTSLTNAVPPALAERSRDLLTQALPAAVRTDPADLPEPGALLVIHDAHHPFVTIAQVQALHAAALAQWSDVSDPGEGSMGLIGLVEVTDTLKRLGPDGVIRQTVARAERRAAIGLFALRIPAHGSAEQDLTTWLADVDRLLPHDLTTASGQVPGASAALRVDPGDPQSLSYAEAVWASSSSATATSPG